MELDSEGPQPDYMAQGYAHPRDHSGHGHACRTHASRMLGSAMLPAGVNMGSLRVSAPGWEGWIIDGFRVRWPGCASWWARRQGSHSLQHWRIMPAWLLAVHRA